MKLIELTLKNNTPVWINPEHIGHLYVEESYVEPNKTIPVSTRIGITTHNNGGLTVKQTPEQIITLIQTTRQFD
jgi:hypothetical protein